jgi:hypothetical protein
MKKNMVGVRLGSRLGQDSEFEHVKCGYLRRPHPFIPPDILVPRPPQGNKRKNVLLAHVQGISPTPMCNKMWQRIDQG